MLQETTDLIIWPRKDKLKYIVLITNIEVIAFSYLMKKNNVYFEIGQEEEQLLLSFRTFQKFILSKVM